MNIRSVHQMEEIKRLMAIIIIHKTALELIQANLKNDIKKMDIWMFFQETLQSITKFYSAGKILDLPVGEVELEGSANASQIVYVNNGTRYKFNATFDTKS